MTTDTQELQRDLRRYAGPIGAVAADKLEALQEENERLNCNATVLQEMHDEDIKEINKHKLHIKHIGNDALRTENAELRARLAAVGKQEPVGYVHRCADLTLSIIREKGFYKEYEMPLFAAAAAGASPVEPSQAQCPTCGSDCNERDELIKAEREIERLKTQPSQAGELSDTTLLDFIEQHHYDSVFPLGSTWYSRLSHGQPYRKHSTLRAAIIAAINAKESK